MQQMADIDLRHCIGYNDFYFFRYCWCFHQQFEEEALAQVINIGFLYSSQVGKAPVE